MRFLFFKLSLFLTLSPISAFAASPLPNIPEERRFPLSERVLIEGTKQHCHDDGHCEIRTDEVIYIIGREDPASHEGAMEVLYDLQIGDPVSIQAIIHKSENGVSFGGAYAASKRTDELSDRVLWALQGRWAEVIAEGDPVMGRELYFFGLDMVLYHAGDWVSTDRIWIAPACNGLDDAWHYIKIKSFQSDQDTCWGVSFLGAGMMEIEEVVTGVKTTYTLLP